MAAAGSLQVPGCRACLGTDSLPSQPCYSACTTTAAVHLATRSCWTATSRRFHRRRRHRGGLERRRRGRRRGPRGAGTLTSAARRAEQVCAVDICLCLLANGTWSGAQTMVGQAGSHAVDSICVNWRGSKLVLSACWRERAELHAPSRQLTRREASPVILPTPS